MRTIKFFTSFDRINMPLKYVTVNPYTYQRFNSWFTKYHSYVREILLDTGVDTLFNLRKLKDYPPWYIRQYIRLINTFNKLAKKYNVKVFIVIPDIPVDYDGRENLYPWNVKRTVEYIEYFKEKVIPKHSNLEFVPVVQGKKDSILSVITTYKKYYHLYKEFEHIALGPTCSTRRYKKLANMILRFDAVVEQEHHAFGPSIKTIKLIHNKVRNMYSFDSTAYMKVYTKYKYREYSSREAALIHFIKSLPPNIQY